MADLVSTVEKHSSNDSIPVDPGVVGGEARSRLLRVLLVEDNADSALPMTFDEEELGLEFECVGCSFGFVAIAGPPHSNDAALVACPTGGRRSTR